MGTVREIGTGRRPPEPSILIGLVAHDAKKEALARFMRAHRRLATHMRFMAPEDTATAIADLSLDVEVLAPDTQGGDLQLAAAVVEGRLDAVIFFHDTLAALPSEPSMSTMLKVCDLGPIPLATNVAAAEVLLHHLERILAREDAAAASPAEPEDVNVDRVLILTGPWSEDGRDPAAGS